MSLVENHSQTTQPGGVTGRGFVAGRSGNPGGRPRGLARRVRELIGDDGERVVQFMLAVMENPRERTRDRLEAAKWFGDRAFGKPTSTLDVDVAQRPLPIDPNELANRLTLDELDQLILLVEKGWALPSGSFDSSLQ